MERIPMTPRGRTALMEELKKLKTIERPKIVQEISIAREHGDLSENAEYHAAKEKQSFIEGRIREVEDKLGRAEVVEFNATPSRVTFGCGVKVLDVESGEQVLYWIVGEDEADIKQKKISYKSPLARAILNKEVGDLAEVNAPKGVKELEVLEITTSQDE